MLITILATIVVLGVLIFVHELGHFLTAKLVDIEVPRFSIGLGPKMVGFRRGETEYVISWLPLGGYVKMAGMEEMERIEGGPSEGRDATGLTPPGTDLGLAGEAPRRPGPRDFESKSLPARALVISAGVIMNTLFALFIFAFGALVWGVEQVPEPRIAAVEAERLPAGAEPLAELPAGAELVAIGEERVGDWMDLRRVLLTAPPGPTAFRFDDAPAVVVDLPASDTARVALYGALRPELRLDPVVGGVSPGLPAERAGLRPGDRILAADGEPVEAWDELVALVESHAGRPLRLTVARAEDTLRVTLVPEPAGADRAAGQPAAVIGIVSRTPRERPGPVGALAHGAEQTWQWVSITVGFLGDLITGEQSARNLGGPILIGQVSGRVARAGLEAFLNFMAIFSINLAVLNLLPIPILDGGHLLFLGVEAVRGRALSLEQRMRLSQVGFLIVVAIMVWALANDVLRLFGI